MVDATWLLVIRSGWCENEAQRPACENVINQSVRWSHSITIMCKPAVFVIIAYCLHVRGGT